MTPVANKDNGYCGYSGYTCSEVSSTPKRMRAPSPLSTKLGCAPTSLSAVASVAPSSFVRVSTASAGCEATRRLQRLQRLQESHLLRREELSEDS